MIRFIKFAIYSRALSFQHRATVNAPLQSQNSTGLQITAAPCKRIDIPPN